MVEVLPFLVHEKAARDRVTNCPGPVYMTTGLLWSYEALLNFIFFMNLVARENQLLNDQEIELILKQFRRQTKVGTPPGAQPMGSAAREKCKKPGRF